MADTHAPDLAPGVTVEARDEEWLVTNVTSARDGKLVSLRGLTELVRDHTATLYTALDKVTRIDPAAVTVEPDASAGFRTTRLWIESMLRSTPVPLYQEELAVAEDMLADPLDYQLDAVKKALSSDNTRPRMLIADAVGLGKTLEIGMILAELIRRGRGERILVVTPRHVLEQFQQELWTRFSVPLVRLDSLGIQKVRQRLPISRNPFTYFPRVIVSMDTLKQAKYRAQLEKSRWDAVVIDEIHNFTNRGTQNNQLARTLAPTTEALLLASATPHNGDPDSFKEILRLLDPTSVLPNGEIDTSVAKRLIIRRNRRSQEVAQVVGDKWADRDDPRHILVAPTDTERAIGEELKATWTDPDSGSSPGENPLFGWTLTKANLSSPAALKETLDNRLKAVGQKTSPRAESERAALERLAGLTERHLEEGSSKLDALVSYLEEIGVGPAKRATTRAVVFSERVATLSWLKESLEERMGFKEGAVRILHGGLDDTEQLAIIDSFKRENSPIKVLVTGDVASEGVNLHEQCHHLVHFDIPWSLIRIQQRNGRIDRYGQRQTPQIVTLLLDPADESTPGDLHVLQRLVDREAEANHHLGDSTSLMGRYTAGEEEKVVQKILARERAFDDEVKTPEQAEQDARGLGSTADGADDISSLLDALGLSLEDIAADEGSSTATSAGRQSLFPNEKTYLKEALNAAFHDQPSASHAGGGVSWRDHGNDTAELAPPPDLQRRLDFLPQDYVDYRQVKEKVVLATSETTGADLLERAKHGASESTWPSAHFLGPLHPVTEWAVDRALANMSRKEIPAATADVDAPAVLLMGTLTNRRGQVISRSFIVSSPTELGIMSADPIPDPVAWLRGAGLDERAINPREAEVSEDDAKLVRRAVEAARGILSQTVAAADVDARRRIDEFTERADRWEELAKGATRGPQVKRSGQLIERERKLVSDFTPSPNPLIRPVVLLVPKR